MATFGSWSVDAERIVHIPSGYEIERSRAGEERSPGISEWALHMIEKEWCAMEEFVPALMFALRSIPNSIDWHETGLELQAEAYHQIVTREALRRTQSEKGFGHADLDTIDEEVLLLKSVGWRPVVE